MKNRYNILVIAALGSCMSCGDQFLDLQYSLSQRVPRTIEDYQALLDNSTFMIFNSPHALGILGGDEFTISDAVYNGYSQGPSSSFQINAYTWNSVIYQGGEPKTIDWNSGYTRVLYSNIALDGLKSMANNGSSAGNRDNVRGIALFQRSWAFYSLAQLFCKAYSPVSAETDLGLPLRLEADPTAKVPRSTLSETYHRIITDLEAAVPLLSERIETPFRPSRPAALALLAKVYMQVEDYAKARESAEECLSLSGTLMDYNAIDTGLRYSFGAYGNGNPEIIFLNALGSVNLISSARMNIADDLYASYDSNDLRRALFFHEETDGRITFKGSYLGTSRYFTGLAVDEVYLLLAEAYARLQDFPKSRAQLNELLSTRVRTGFFEEVTEADEFELLKLINLEGNKQLLLRGIRWETLKRLNKENRFRKTLFRTVNGVRHELPPGDKRWVWPLPQEAVAGGNYQQNER